MVASENSAERSGWAPTRSAYLPAAIAFLVILAAGIYAGTLNRTLHQQVHRAEVQTKVNLVRAKLEGHINANIQLVRGLVATITTEPDMDQQRFSALAGNIFREQTQLRNVAGAPGMVVSLMYPLAGNERAIGLDYRTDPGQREGALRARDTRQLVMAGPVDLKQGGQGFIGRFPVYYERDGQEQFWGILSAVIDVERLYRDSGILDESLGLELALVGRDGLGRAGDRFFGSDNVLNSNPVTADIVLPSGSWQIAAIPTGGWTTIPDNARLFRLGLLAALLLVVGPILYAGRLFVDRQRHFGEIAKREKDLSLVTQHLRLALDASKLGVWVFNFDTGELSWDARVREIYGRAGDPGPFDHESWVSAIHPDDVDRAISEFNRAAEARAAYHSDYRLVRPDGEVRHVRSMAQFFEREDSGLQLIGADWDMTDDVRLREDLVRARLLAELRSAEIEAAKARIEHNALHDSLTGLPNRRYLDQMLEKAAAGHSRDAALLQIDLDRFKQINDTLGHAAGDAMLVHAARILSTNVRTGDFVARIGGDEFVVFCHEELDPEHLTSLAERIVKQMREPVPYQGHLCRFGVSIGVAQERGAAADPTQLLVNADIALYRAKSRGRNCFEFFTKELQAEIVSNKILADEILGGLERNEFIAHYQPQFDAQTHDIVGVEALVRWRHPTRGLLAPADFLSIADELNVVSTLDRMILEQALADYRRWRDDGLGIERISVNVSARRLQDSELINGLKGLDIPAGVLAFELVESIFLDESDDLIVWNVNQIKELGIDIEIDDFGTGYASIVSLQKLKPRRLKIDRQLVMPILDSRKQRRLLESIVDIGKSLDIEVLAEGVETMEHARVLRECGCDALQGFAFARAMTEVDLRAFVTARNLQRAS